MSKDDDNDDHGDGDDDDDNEDDHGDGWMERIIMRIDGWDENVHPFRTQP